MNDWSDTEDLGRQAAKTESAGESVLLSLLWWRRRGWTVRTQHPIAGYRIDLVVPEARVAIEVDSMEGHGSGTAMEHDAEKRNLVVAGGWAPLTFSARQTLFKPHDTLARVLAEVERRLPPTTKRPSEVLREAKHHRRLDLSPAQIETNIEGVAGLLSVLANGPCDGGASRPPRRRP